MKYLSVCAGIEAATVAWHPLGWEPIGFSEIEKFPSAVLAHHYPDVLNYGDMTKHEEWPETDLDVLVGGTPCQSFSVAGLRQGMADPRGNLALVYLAIAEQYRPRWLVWENVPGVLSSDGGRDFGSIIGGMVELGYCPSWRVLDAQYFGVAQRRRRVFVVASSRDWRDSAEVLFEPASLRRHPAPSRGEGKTAPTIPSRSTAGGGLRTDFDCDGGLIPDVVGALSDGAHCGGGLNGQDAYSGRVIPWSFNWQNGGGYGNANEGLGIAEDEAGPLSASQTQAVAFAQNQRIAATNMAVRRLTPLECERLQGFPDGYTDISGASDSARYKALGNSMAVPVMRWIGKRISDYESQM